MTPGELADDCDRCATANERLSGGPTYESERDRATAAHLRDYQRLLDAIGDPDVLKVHADELWLEGRRPLSAHLRRIADAIEGAP